MFNEIYRISGKLDKFTSMIADAIGADMAAQLANPKTAIGALSTMMADLQRSLASMQSTSVLASAAHTGPATQTTASSPTQGAAYNQLLQFVNYSRQMRRMQILLEVVQLKVRLKELENELDRMALSPNSQVAPVPMSNQELLDQLKSPMPPAPPSFAREMLTINEMMRDVQQLQDMLTHMLESQTEAAKAIVRNLR